ncbi:methyltransferase, FkbM family [Haloechinothrix alba]|uniref:Methyltransferase, FkbM family n=1 Tax=Haloechinothrix alba TaxID=664784 RepID=A0A238Z0K5_9PSEU|nr:FkbM family methyltransferase [Haloechinothrix alba]SNR76897.1 methyltransferase, FkbM family [Haloechinothrix alba]
MTKLISPAVRRRVRGLLERAGFRVRRVAPGTVLVSRGETATKHQLPNDAASARSGLAASLVDGVGEVHAPNAVKVHPLGHGAAMVESPRAARRHVFDIHKALFQRMTTAHVADQLQAYGVNCVIDVGAHKGQYARQLRQAGYNGHIVSFEPVPEIFAHLESKAEKDPKWTVYGCALGRAEDTLEMNVVSGTMSSILPPSEYGTGRYKRFRDITSVEVPVRRLDQMLDEIIPDELTEPRLYLKMDTQGYDLEVFAGMGERMHEVVGMQSEVAVLQIYEGMPRLTEAIDTFEKAGFEITGMFPVTREAGTGRVLEFDCVLARTEALT